MRRFPSRTLAVLAAGAVLAGCSNAGEDFGFDATAGGVVGAFVYLDRDGDLGPTGADTVLAGARVALLAAGTTDTLFSDVTDASGNAVFTDVPFGDYELVVVPSSVGDSVDIQDIDAPDVTVRFDDPQHLATVRVGFPSAASIGAARALAPGERIFIKGVVLAGVNGFGDTTAHVGDGTSAIRLTNAKNEGPLTAPGDSVRVLGTVAVRNGQPVLDQARVYLFAFAQGQPPVTGVTTQEASTADGGVLDAALVSLAGAIIGSDTMTVNGDYQFSADDGSGPVLVILDQDVTFPLAQFRPGRTLDGRGVLVPDGSGQWIFKPRVANDVTVN